MNLLKSLGVSSLITTAGSLFIIPSFGRAIEQRTNSIFSNTPPDLGSLLRVLWAFPEKWLLLKAYFEEQGYSSNTIDMMNLGSVRFPTVDEIQRLYLLGALDDYTKYHWVSPAGNGYNWDVSDFLHANQVPKELAKLFMELTHRPFGLDTAVRLYRRYGEYKTIDDPFAVDETHFHPVSSRYDSALLSAKRLEGFDKISNADLLNAHRVFPGVDDTIRFAVREVYSPEQAQALSLFEDVPKEFLNDARKAGLAAEDALKYWGAHWQLPSYTQGTEMFHRGIITLETLEMLLRALDYAPVWRKRMINLAYRVIGRVDIRRMYAEGVIPRKNLDDLPEEKPEDRSKIPEIVWRYLDMGYNWKDACALARWTDRHYPNPAIETALKEVNSAYQKGYIDDKQYETLLLKIDLPINVRELVKKSAKAKRTQSLIDIAVKKYVPLFLTGEITEAELNGFLKALGLSEASIKIVIDAQEVQAAGRARGLTDAQIIRLYRGGVIESRSKALSLLTNGGLVKSAAELLLKEADGKKAKKNA